MMHVVEKIAYLLPLCVYLGTLTALTKSDDPAQILSMATRYTLSLALGIGALATALTLMNLWV